MWSVSKHLAAAEAAVPGGGRSAAEENHEERRVLGLDLTDMTDCTWCVDVGFKPNDRAKTVSGYIPLRMMWPLSWTAEEPNFLTITHDVVDTPNAAFAIVMVDPDAPSRRNPSMRSFLHWYVGGIRGETLRAGITGPNIKKHMHVIVPYRKPEPPAGSGVHRYVFLLYRELYPRDSRSGDFGSSRHPDMTDAQRAGFDVNVHMAAHKLVGWSMFCSDNRFP